MFINKALIRFASGNGKQIVLTSLLESILTGLSTLIALCSAWIVRILMGEAQIAFFTESGQIFMVMGVLIAVRFLLAKTKAVQGTKCGIQIKEHLRQQLLEKLFVLGPAYTGKKRTGDLATTISNRVEWLNNYYTIYLPAVLSAIINAVVIIVVLFAFDWATALVCLIGCAGVLGCPMLFFRAMAERGNKEWEIQTAYYADCLDGIQGITTLKALNANQKQKEKIHVQGEELRKAVMGQLKITMVENGVLEFFARLGSAFSLAVVAIRFVEGHLPAYLLVDTLFLVGACFMPMLSLLSAWHMGYRGITASFGIEALLKEPETFIKEETRMEETKAQKKSLKTPLEKETLQEGITFKNVSFAYKEEEDNVLSNISFHIPYQTVTALVGPSGSGKSTIAQLLAGFYIPQTGAIQIGNQILSKETVEAIQNKISVVWQDSHIFYGTVYENILIGKPTASFEEVKEAAKEAHIHDFVQSLPEGYNTILGERGMRFSGGERQRIAIARAFLRNAPIIIFDEATSALDRKNEIAIQESFQKLSKGKTALVIAHRLATIENADQICILEGGKIQDYGTHQSLLQSSLIYEKLMGNQVSNAAERRILHA